MKRICTSLLFLAKQTVSNGIFTLFFFAFFCTAAIGQNSNPLEDLGDLSAVKWKAQPDLGQTIAQEQARIDATLADPNLQSPDRSLFMSYHRLLGYVKTDVQGGMLVYEAVTTNYEKVLTESETDQDLKNMPPGSLFTLMPGLVEVLTEAPVAGQ